MKMIEVTSDPRSDFFDLVRKESLPADELMGRRMETGLLAVLAQLRATANWHRIMREWVYADPPSTVLGEAEWRYFEGRGTTQTPGLPDAGLVLPPPEPGCGLPSATSNSLGSFEQIPSHPHREQLPHARRVVDGPGDQLEAELVGDVDAPSG